MLSVVELSGSWTVLRRSCVARNCGGVFLQHDTFVANYTSILDITIHLIR